MAGWWIDRVADMNMLKVYVPPSSINSPVGTTGLNTPSCWPVRLIVIWDMLIKSIGECQCFNHLSARHDLRFKVALICSISRSNHCYWEWNEYLNFKIWKWSDNNTAFAHRYLLDHWSQATSRPVHKWMGDRLGLPGAVYTIVGLREPRKSDGSSDWLWVGRKRTSMDVGAVSIRRDPKKSTIWSTWHIYKAMNDIMNDNRPC